MYNPWLEIRIDEKKVGKKSKILNMSQSQILEAYSGSKLVAEKRNAKVDGKEIENSGVADYILVVPNSKKRKNFMLRN